MSCGGGLSFCGVRARAFNRRILFVRWGFFEVEGPLL